MGVTPSLPRISVVTPSFNQARFIAATMESIHGQGYPNLEHIVIDGGSTDGSVEIIESYSDRLAFWTSEPDEGQTDALAKGFSRATGDILCWLNSDDLFEPWTFAEVAAWFRDNPESHFVYGDSTWIDADGSVIKPKREHRFSRFVWMYDHNFIPQPSSFWTREIYERVGGIDPRFDYAMDADLWIRFAEHTKPRHVRRPWSRMRFYPEQKNTALRSHTNREGAVIRSRYRTKESRFVRGAKRRAARALRVLLKLAAGGFPLSEIRQHIGVIRKESWEQRQVRKSLESTPDRD